MTTKNSSELVLKLQDIVESTLDSTAESTNNETHLTSIVESTRLLLEDGLESKTSVLSSVWSVIQHLGSKFPEIFKSSTEGIEALATADRLDNQEKEEAWIRQAIQDGMIFTYLEKIPVDTEVKAAYRSTAVIMNPKLRMRVFEILKSLKESDKPGVFSFARSFDLKPFKKSIVLPVSTNTSEGQGRSLTVSSIKQSDDKDKDLSRRVIGENTDVLKTEDSALEESKSKDKLVREHSSEDSLSNQSSFSRSEDDHTKDSSSFGRLFRWSRKYSKNEASNLPTSSSFTLEERASAAQLLLKELKDISKRVLRQYSTNKYPLSIRSYPLSKLCSLYEEAFCFGMRPCPLFKPSGPIKYLSDLEDILTNGQASPIALLFGLETILDVKGLDITKVRALDKEDEEKFSIWLHDGLLDKSFGTKMESVLSCHDFLQGWYYPRSLMIDEDLSQQFIASYRSIETIEILPESPVYDKETPVSNIEQNSIDLSHEIEKEIQKDREIEEDDTLMPVSQELNTNESVVDLVREQLSLEDEEQDLHANAHNYENKLNTTANIHQENISISSNDIPQSSIYPVESTHPPSTSDSPLHNIKLRSGDHLVGLSPSHVGSFTTEEEEWSGVWKDIDVLGYEIRGKNQNDQYAVYIIEVMASDGTQWQTARRFSELEALRKTLTRKNVNLPHSWSNLIGAKGVHGKARFGSDVLEARLGLLRQCLWDFKVAFPEALVWQPVSEFLDAPLSLLRGTKSRQRLSISQDPRLYDKFSERVERLKEGMILIVDLPTPVPDEVLFEIQQGCCPGCQGYLPSICHHKPIFKGSPSPRKCDYTELLYCHACHHLDTALLPSRVLHQWDFRKCLVSVNAKNYILSMFPHPCLSINAVNPGLLASVPVLGHLQYLRLDIMEKLNLLRRKGTEGKATAEACEQKAGSNIYLLQNAEYWSMKDLGDISRGVFATLPRWIELVHSRITKIVTSEQQQQQYSVYEHL